MTFSTDDVTWRPAHAYIPGQTERHREDLFDFLKADIAASAVNDLPMTRAWQYAEAFYRDGYYWEAHELLEAVWMVCPPNSVEKIYVQAKIQSANAALKKRMGMYKAEARLLHNVEALLTEVKQRSDGILFDGLVDF